MLSVRQLLKQRQRLLRRLTQYPEALNGSFFERELDGKTRLYLSRMVNGTQRQTYIASKHQAAVARALKQYRGLQRTIEQLCEINLQLVKQGKDGLWPTLNDTTSGDKVETQ
jgi:hypothetical protein